MENIIKSVLKATGINYGALMSKCRQSDIVIARHIIIRIAKNRRLSGEISDSGQEYTNEYVGRKLNLKLTTVSNGYKNFGDRMDVSESLRRFANTLEEKTNKERYSNDI